MFVRASELSLSLEVICKSRHGPSFIIPRSGVVVLKDVVSIINRS